MTSATISIICAISFYYTKHSAFVQHHVHDRIELQYHQKLKRVQLSPNRHTSHSEIDVNSTPVRKQIQGVMRPPIFDASPRGTARIQLIDPKSLKIPILVREDTPHQIAAMVGRTDNKPYSPYSPYDNSMSYVDDDDILTPLQTPRIFAYPGYGATINNKLEDKKKTVTLKENKEKGIPKYMVKHHRFNCMKYMIVFKNIKYLALSLSLNFFVTFLWFPGIVTNIQSSFKVINDGDWMPIVMITEFNIIDFIGRQFASNYKPKWLKESNLWTCSLLRLVTYPLFIMFYEGYIINDYLLHLVLIISALSNGWVVSISFMWFPRNCDKNQQQMAASIMNLALVTGLLCGSCVALLVQPFFKDADFV